MKLNKQNPLKPIIKKVAKETLIDNDNFFKVAIGASSGGLESLNVFFDHLPSNSGMAYIIIQHLDPTRKSLLAELLAKHTKMPVTEIKNKTELEPNTVYTIPPNKTLRVKNSTLLLSNITESSGKRTLINTFFNSLAEDQKEKAIGIILSGTGNDGTEGLAMIKKAGGLTIVQDLKTSKYKGMPQCAISANAHDYILEPIEMPNCIMKTKPRKIFHQHALTELTVPTEHQLKIILSLIHHQTGYDFLNYKTNTIIRRIHKRITTNQIHDIEDYISLLKNNTTEVTNLYNDFLIGVTTFFRDKEVFKKIEQKIIPQLLINAKQKKEIRIWVCGCSTGEEAYTLAMLCKEALDKNNSTARVTIFATDIDKQAIAIARNAYYSASIVANISQTRLALHFIKKEKGFQIKKEIRQMVVFANHNIISDPPFSKMDMITCRNLLIYLNSDLQKKIIPIFHYSLNNDGALILGKSESLGDFENSFSIFDSKLKIYNKKSISIPLKYNAIQNLQFIDKNNYSIEKAKTTMSSKKINMSSITDKILLENYAPPSIIVDEKNNAIYYSGNTSQYIESPIGETNLNIIDNAKRGLKSHLELAIQKARASNQLVEIKNIDIKVNNHFKTINLLIKPIFLKEKELSALMVIFENADKLQSSDDINKPIIKDSNKASATAIEKELKITRDHLQTLIDELKTSNEDLQITNEEYQSSNEELQSANEELETSREELQSVNEELITVNTELSEKIEQLSQANDDLDNLLSSTELATVFLDRKLNIKRFTPAATKIFNLIPTDIDRPVTHLSSNILYKALAEDVKQVLKTLIIKSVEVQAIDKTWYYMRILPYRTAENIIEGVLITFIDITTQKKTENKLKNVNENLNMVIDHLPIVPYTCVASNNIKITYVGASSEKVMGFLPDQFINKNTFWINRVHPADRKKIKLLYATIGKKGTMQITFRWKCSDGKYKHFLNYVKHIFSENKNESYIVGVWHEKIMDK